MKSVNQIMHTAVITIEDNAKGVVAPKIKVFAVDCNGDIHYPGMVSADGKLHMNPSQMYHMWVEDKLIYIEMPDPFEAPNDARIVRDAFITEIKKQVGA